MNITILSSACCHPSMASFDAQAKKVVEQALKETGAEAEIKIIPAATAIYGGAIPKPIVTILINKFSQNENGPAILINGEIVAYGVPQLEEIKAVLNKFNHHKPV